MAGTELNYENAFGRRIEDYDQKRWRLCCLYKFELPSICRASDSAVTASYNTILLMRRRLFPHFNIKYNPLSELTLRASYAKGFRAPSLRELYYVFVDVNHQIYGNTHLKAEQSDTWNFSATYRLQNENEVLDIIGKGYYNDIKNLVDFAFIGNDKYSYVNIVISSL